MFPRPSRPVSSVTMYGLLKQLICLSGLCAAASGCDVCTKPFPGPQGGLIKCGQCVECRLAYSREWAIRMVHEMQCHDKSCMLTLTYDDVHLPHYGQLLKEDLQKFFKRLRKNTGSFRYVACGEYGDLNRRPHFHVALFGMDFSDDRIHHGFAKGGDKTYESRELARSWQFGNHDIGTLNFESCAYIARYILKKMKGAVLDEPLAILEDGELIMPNPPFLLMSRGRGIGGGIGGNWFRQYFMSDVLPHAACITPSGAKLPVPRYYKDLVREFYDDNYLLKMSDLSYRRIDLNKLIEESSDTRKLARDAYFLSRANKREI